MGRLSRRAALAAALVVAGATPAFALYRQLSTDLIGPAIGGVAPSGRARVDQSGLPQRPGELQIEVANVNLPDGTALDIALDGQLVGTLNLVGGRARLTTTIPLSVGRGSRLAVGVGGTAILANPTAWKT